MKTPQHEAIESKKEGLKKTSSSVRSCRHCGKVISKETRHESGHNEWDHERKGPMNCAMVK